MLINELRSGSLVDIQELILLIASYYIFYMGYKIKMQKSHEVLIRAVKLLSLLFFFALAGCSIMPMNVAKVELADNPHPILLDILDDSSHLYFVNSSYMSKYIPASVRVGSNARVEVPYKTYTKFIVKPGRHWVFIENIWGNSGYLCKNFEKNTNYFYSLEMAFDTRVMGSNQGALENIKQTRKIHVEPINAIVDLTQQAESILITAESKYLERLRENLEEKYASELKLSGGGLLVNLKLIELDEGSQTGRFIFGSLDKFKAYLTIEAEFFIKEKKVDSLILIKEVRMGLLGGNLDRLTPFFANDIESYINCVYRDGISL